MNYIYVLLGNNFSWDDMVIYTDDNEARTASIINPNLRVEIFSITKSGYKPTNCHYKNGNLIET